MSERKYTQAILCLHCSNTSPMVIASTYDRIKSYDAPDDSISWDEGYVFEVLECPSCNKVMFRKGYWHDYLNEYNELEYEVLYPNSSGSIRALPENISKAFEAAQRVKHIDSNAFAVLLGRVLDLVCIDKNASGDSLFARLKFLADSGVMPLQLAEMAQQLRQLRNIAAHADLGELTLDEIPILESLNKAILEYVYSAPALVESVRKKLERLKTQKP